MEFAVFIQDTAVVMLLKSVPIAIVIGVASIYALL